MRYAQIREMDISNGEGVGVALFVQGCHSPHCKNCFNPETWDFNGGVEYTPEELLSELKKSPIGHKVTLSGGDPLDQSENDLKELYVFLKSFKKKYPDKNIWIYSGFTYDELCHKNSQTTSNILELCDILVDGPYIESLRDTSLAFRGSHNQNIIKIH